MKKIGIIGAGIMASGMIQNFLKHGYEVYVWNRTPEHLQPVRGAGAQVRASPKAVAETADIVIECVSDDKASRSVWASQEGILHGASTSKTYIVSSSLSIGWVDELGALCRAKSLDFLDMPLTGSRSGAEGGTLKLLVGGDEVVLEGIREELGAISDGIFYFGPSGSGMRFKLMFNTLLAIQTNAAAQAALLAQRAGIDAALFRQAIIGGNMGTASPATSNALEAIESPSDTVNFALGWLEKDLRYAQAMAKQYGIDFDLLNATQADYERAVKAGLGTANQTKIAELYQKEK